MLAASIWIFVLLGQLQTAPSGAAAPAPESPPPSAATAKPRASSLNDSPLVELVATQLPGPATSAGVTPGASTTPLDAAPGEGVSSDAERIARLQRSVETDETRLRNLKQSLTDPDSEFAKAEATFKTLDAELEATRRKLVDAKTAGDALAAAELEKSLLSQAEAWKTAKTGFELELEERRAQLASIATLEAKIQRDREAAKKLLAPAPAAQAVPATPAEPSLPSAPAPTASPAATPPLAPAVAPVAPADPAAQAPPAASVAPLSPAPERPKPPLLAPSPLLPSSPAPAEANVAPGVPPAKPPSQELKAAADRVEKLSAVAAEAEHEALSISQRLELLQTDIEQQRKLQSVALKKLDSAEETIERLTKALEQETERGPSWRDLWTQLTEAQQRAAASRGESRKLADQLDLLQSERSSLQREQLAALQEAKAKQREVEEARSDIHALTNPFSLRNILAWLQTRGLIVLLVVLATSILLGMGNRVEPRLTQLLITTSPRGSREERENRASTLVGVGLNVVRTVAVVVGGVIVLEQFNIPVGPFLGGAAVIGLAVAFGAQSLIKDYFTGFMVLLEQQYMINDVIKIGEISGQVERITMRMTVLRDLEGRVHFVPHGQIATVTNLTHGWSRAVIDVNVSYNENLDRVIDVLVQLSQELRNDPKFGAMMLDNPEMLGVNELSDSAVIVRMMVKTRPLRQWDVKREWQKRIKRRFDELKIEIPLPHRVVYLRHDPPPSAESAPSKKAA